MLKGWDYKELKFILRICEVTANWRWKKQAW